MPITQISPRELRARLDSESGEPIVLMDVREPWEFEHCRIEGAVLVPMQTIPERKSEFDSGSEIVLICHHGARSQQVALYLERNGFERLYNLAGGVASWAREVDPAMPTY